MLDGCLMDFGWCLAGFLGLILMEFEKFLGGFRWILDGFWIDFDGF